MPFLSGTWHMAHGTQNPKADINQNIVNMPRNKKAWRTSKICKHTNQLYGGICMLFKEGILIPNITFKELAHRSNGR
jgi:uncharacterized FlgJ-related protein